MSHLLAWLHLALSSYYFVVTGREALIERILYNKDVLALEKSTCFDEYKQLATQNVEMVHAMHGQPPGHLEPLQSGAAAWLSSIQMCAACGVSMSDTCKARCLSQKSHIRWARKFERGLWLCLLLLLLFRALPPVLEHAASKRTSAAQRSAWRNDSGAVHATNQKVCSTPIFHETLATVIKPGCVSKLKPCFNRCW